MPSLRKHNVWLVIAVVTLVAAGAVWFRSDHSVADAVSPEPTVAKVPSACHFVVGEDIEYEVSNRSITSLDLGAWNVNRGARPSVAQLSRHSLEAKLLWHVEAKEKSGWRVTCALAEVHFTAVGERVDRTLEEALSKPFMFTVLPDCQFHTFGFKPETAARVRQQLVSLLKSAEFILVEPASMNWNAIHEDGTGSYRAEYRREATDVREIHKRRVEYTAVRPPAPGVVVKAKVFSSKVDLRLESRGRWLENLDADEHIELTVDLARLADVQSKLHIRSINVLEKLRSGMLQPTELIWSSASPENRPSQGLPIPEPTPEIAGLTFSQAVSEFRALLNGGKAESLSSAVTFLAQYLRAHPDNSNDLLRLARGNTLSDKEQSVLFHALELTGTKESESALRDGLGDHRLSPQNRMRAAVALSGAPTAGKEAAESLLSTAAESHDSSAPDRRDVSATALLALGALGKRAGELDMELAAQVRSELTRQLESGERPEWRAVVVDAIGNLSDPSTLDLLANTSRDPDPFLRVHVASTLQRFPGSGADEVATEWLGREKEERVRAGIYQASARWQETAHYIPSPGLQQAIASRLSLETNPAVRASAIGGLGPAARLGPGLARDTLVKHFREETTPELLVLIGRYLKADQLPNRPSK
jgi:hypothetical protein